MRLPLVRRTYDRLRRFGQCPCHACKAYFSCRVLVTFELAMHWWIAGEGTYNHGVLSRCWGKSTSKEIWESITKHLKPLKLPQIMQLQALLVPFLSATAALATYSCPANKYPYCCTSTGTWPNCTPLMHPTALSGKVADDGEGEYERLTSGSEFGEFTGSCPSTRPYALCCYSVSLTSLGGGKVIVGLSGMKLIVHVCAVATGGVSVQRPDPEILHRHPNPGLLSRMDFKEDWMLAK